MDLDTRRRVNYAGVLAGPVAWTTLFMFVPYAILLAYSFYSTDFPKIIPDFQIGNYLQLFQDPQYYQVFLRTLKIALLVTICAILLAYPLAYFLVFKIRSPRVRMMISCSVIVPLWVSYLLRAYTWKTILGNSGRAQFLPGLVGYPERAVGSLSLQPVRHGGDAHLHLRALHGDADLHRAREDPAQPDRSLEAILASARSGPSSRSRCRCRCRAFSPVPPSRSA